MTDHGSMNISVSVFNELIMSHKSGYRYVNDTSDNTATVIVSCIGLAFLFGSVLPLFIYRSIC